MRVFTWRKLPFNSTEIACLCLCELKGERENGKTITGITER